MPGDKPGRAIRGLSKRVGEGAGNLSRLPWFFLGELDIHARSYPTLCKNWFKLITIHNKGTKTWWNCWPAHDCMGQHFAQGIQHHNNKHCNSNDIIFEQLWLHAFSNVNLTACFRKPWRRQRKNYWIYLLVIVQILDSVWFYDLHACHHRRFIDSRMVKSHLMWS